MSLKKSTGLALAGVLLLAGGSLVLMGQTAGGAQEKEEKVLKKTPMAYSKPDSGKQMYMDYCAACHGMHGKGDGPAAEFLKSPLPDLSMMAKKNNGKFPAEHFAAVLRFGAEGKRAHGTDDMPIWGQLFATQHKPELAQLRIHNLSEFVELMQQK